MLKIRTVCGNGIGSSLMCANKVKQICDKHGIQADVASIDFSNAAAEKADLYVTIQEMAVDLEANGLRAVAIRSYVSGPKIEEDILPTLQELANK